MKITESMKEEFKDRLKKIVSKKYDTTMVFPIAQFEMVFGHLWGNDLPEDQLNEEQKANRFKWKELRHSILNNGNHQKRNALKEIDMHDVIWKRYTTRLEVKTPKENE